MRRLLFFTTVFTAANAVMGCDLCQISTPPLGASVVERGMFAGLAEQFTHFGTLQEDGREQPNPLGQKLDSSISQVLAGYHINQRFGVQLAVPMIHRSFRRAEEDGVETGSESGLGDVSLIGRVKVLNRREGEWVVQAYAYGGIKVPTGNSDRLGEEVSEDHAHEGGGGHGEPNGIHGHDLTLGTGSWDGVVGGDFFVGYSRVFFGASTQYAIRSEGDFDYRFANDLTWNGGPGYYLVRNENWRLGLQLIVSGETKGQDEFQGMSSQDSNITSVFLGPQWNLGWTDRLSARLAGDLPVSIDNGGLQAVPDYRIRASVNWQF